VKTATQITIIKTLEPSLKDITSTKEVLSPEGTRASLVAPSTVLTGQISESKVAPRDTHKTSTLPKTLDAAQL
jgi:hypothetical protein